MFLNFSFDLFLSFFQTKQQKNKIPQNVNTKQKLNFTLNYNSIFFPNV